MALNEVKKNCYFLYGDDPVLLNERKSDILNTYFKGNPPEPAYFEGKGSFEEYRNALCGQSLFSSDTAVLIQNPFFLKKAVKSEKEEEQQKEFLETAREIPEETLLIILFEGKPDARTKVVKELKKFCVAEEMGFIKPDQAAGIMAQILGERGKRFEPEAREYLEEVLSTWENVSRPLLEVEVEKIDLMTGKRVTVPKRILEFSLPGYVNQGVFAFADALLSKKVKQILESTDKVFKDTSTEISGLGLISSKFRNIKILKEMERARMPESKIREALGMRSPYAYRYLKRDADKVTEKDAEWMLLGIFNYQLKKRMGDRDMSLKDLFLKYCMERR